MDSFYALNSCVSFAMNAEVEETMKDLYSSKGFFSSFRFKLLSLANILLRNTERGRNPICDFQFNRIHV